MAKTPTIDLKGTSNFDYDEWLEFFRTKTTAGVLVDNIDSLKYKLNPDGYAALMRWMEIFEEPSKMDKLYKGKLEKDQSESIMDIATGDDDEAFYIALIKQNTVQLNSSSVSQQEVARLSQNINIFRKELKEIRSRKPKTGSVLDKVLKAAEGGPVKAKALTKPKAAKKKVTPRASAKLKPKKTTGKANKKEPTKAKAKK